MKFAFDGTTLCDAYGRAGAGIEHYTWSVLLSLAKVATDDKIVVITPKQLSLNRDTILRSYPNIEIIRVNRKIPFLSRHVFLPIKLLLKGVKLIFAPHGQLPFLWNQKSVVVIHDASIFEHPEWFPESSAESFVTKKIVPRTIEKASKLVAVSNATKEQMERVFPLTKGKISVVHAGVSIPEKVPSLTPKFVSLLNGVEDVVLFLGTIEPRKNLLNTLHAFHRFLEMHPERVPVTRFILAGSFGWKTTEIESAIRDVNQVWSKRGGGEVVHAVGYVSEKEKWALLTRANILMMMSHEEGFGLPILEAMSVGTPVVASDIVTHREVAGDAAFYSKPDDPETIAHAITQILLVPEGLGALRQVAAARAEKFSWEKTAESILKIIKET